MKPKITAGIALVVLGFALLAYYAVYMLPEKEAKEMLAEARMTMERGDKESINTAINILTKVIVKYPESSTIPEAYFLIGQGYEKIGLNRLAYLKYSYLIKNGGKNFTGELRREVMLRLAHLNVLKNYSEEGVNQLYGMLSNNYDPEMRSRVYSELGHTYLKLADYQRAKRMFDIAVNEFGSNEEALIGKARVAKHLGYDREAYDLYEYFLKYYGGVSQYTKDVRAAYKNQAYHSGIAAFRMGDYSSSIAYFSRVLKNFPDDSLAENSLYWAGECYFAAGRFDTAIAYFNRVLYNSYTHKDQDAQIKKGFAYFMSKRFDLAAREFQTYLHNYPSGVHSQTAREWKSMSTKELLYRIDSKKLPDLKDEGDESVKPGKEKSIDKSGDDDEEVAGEDVDVSGVELENVAEL
jgi:TolA-binding protein